MEDRPFEKPVWELRAVVDIAVIVLWPIKVLGALFTVCTWWAIGLAALPFVSTDGGPSKWIFAAVFVGWYLFYFCGLIPLHHWLMETSKCWEKGWPAPRHPVRMPRNPIKRIAASSNRFVAQHNMNYAQVYPSDDGNYDLGQTGGLSRYDANRVAGGYPARAYIKTYDKPRCESCDRPTNGERLCECGYYLQAGGRIDWDAQRAYAKVAGLMFPEGAPPPKAARFSAPS